MHVSLIRLQSFMGMLLTDPSAPSASQITSKSSGSASSPSPNATYITTVAAPSPGPRLWDMNMFVYLAVPLLFGTIAIPLISGKLLRFVVKAHTHLMPWYPLAYLIVWLFLLIYFIASTKIDYLSTRLCLDALVVVVVIYQTYRAFRKKEHRILFSGFLVGIAVCLILEWFVRLPVLIVWLAAGTILLVVMLRSLGLGWLIRKLLRKTRWKQTAKP